MKKKVLIIGAEATRKEENKKTDGKQKTSEDGRRERYNDFSKMQTKIK